MHFVYSSVGGAERDTGTDHFETRARIERHLAATSFPATILRPAVAFARPEKYLGARLEIAGDSLTFEQVAAVYEKATGVRTRLVPLPVRERMFEWFAESGYQADVEALRGDFPWLQRFDGFLRRAVARD